MKLRINNLLPLIVVLILAALTLWLRQTAEQSPGIGRISNDKEPEAIAQNLSIVRLNAAGVAQYSMSARRLMHFTADDTTVLESPRFERRDDDGISTTVTAERGRISPARPAAENASAVAEEAFFYGNVQLNRTAGGQAPLQVRTESLRIFPDKDLVRSDRHVTITNGGSSLSGVGMEINKAKGQISLQSQVKGSYHAAKK